MILPEAVREFRKRDLPDYSWIKDIPLKGLQEFIHEMNPPAHFMTRPYKHQFASYILGTELSQFLFFLDAGTGKTKLTLDILTWRYIKAEWDSALILVPNVQNIETWVRNAQTHSQLLVCPLVGSSEKRWDTLEKDQGSSQLYVINYQGLMTMTSSLVPTRKGDKNKRRISSKKIKQLAEMFQAVVYDEIHYCKNSQSLTYRMCNQLSGLIDIRYGLTGTPFGRDPSSLWAQFYLIDRGETLGETLGMFRQSCLSIAASNSWTTRYALRKDMEKKVRNWMRNRSIVYADNECNDLPKCVPVPMPFHLSALQRKYQREIAKGIIDAEGQQLIVQNSFIRMRQVVSGFIGIPGDENTPKMELKLPENPKMELLESLIEEFPEDDKVVISCEFVPSLEMVVDMLNKKKKEKKASWLIGSLYNKTKDKTIWKQFQDDPTMKYFVMISTSGGTGIDLFAANREIIYEGPVRPDVRHQVEKRVYRTGQTKRTYIYDLIAEGSVDKKIVEYNQEGKDLVQALLTDSRTLFQEILREEADMEDIIGKRVH